MEKSLTLEMKYFVLKPKAKSKSDPYSFASQQAMLTYAKIIQSQTNNWDFAQKIKAWAREEHAIQVTFEEEHEAGATDRESSVT
jgi:1,4-alpha-glucan branching enzyme